MPNEQMAGNDTAEPSGERIGLAGTAVARPVPDGTKGAVVRNVEPLIAC
jgi:hypothetical protein